MWCLDFLYCNENQLTQLDVSDNTDLSFLECHNNQLTQPDISKNTDLVRLFCYNNQLIQLDVSKNTKLSFLECYGQKDETGKSQNLTLKLTQLQYDKHKSDNGNDWFAPEDVVDSKV